MMPIDFFQSLVLVAAVVSGINAREKGVIKHARRHARRNDDGNLGNSS